MKYTNKKIAEIVDSEGLEYAVLNCIPVEQIIDPILSLRWETAKEALQAVEALLFPQGLEEWQSRRYDNEDEDDENEDEDDDV